MLLRTELISLALWPTQVKCAMLSRPISFFIRPTRSIVFVRVLPPAPYVTETNAGFQVFKLSIALNNLLKPSSSLGGKNSNENAGLTCSKISLIFI